MMSVRGRVKDFFRSTAHATQIVHPYPSTSSSSSSSSALLCFAAKPSSSRRRRLSATRSRSKEKEKRMADSGGSDWEVVSLTASTYAAAPGPTSPTPPLLPIHETEFPPNPPPAHFFMSQHFNLAPLFSTHLESSGGQELESGGPAVPDGDAHHLDMPRPEISRESERDDAPVLASPAAGNGLQVEGQGGEELQQTTMLCSLPDAATAGSDAAALPAPAATVPVAAPTSGGVGACNSNAARAWWEKTFSFPRNNGTGPLAFRFVFVAGKLQIQEDQTKKISCVSEPLGQVKAGMLGGSPVAQQG